MGVGWGGIWGGIIWNWWFVRYLGSSQWDGFFNIVKGEVYIFYKIFFLFEVGYLWPRGPTIQGPAVCTQYASNLISNIGYISAMFAKYCAHVPDIPKKNIGWSWSSSGWCEPPPQPPGVISPPPSWHRLGKQAESVLPGRDPHSYISPGPPPLQVKKPGAPCRVADAWSQHPMVASNVSFQISRMCACTTTTEAISLLCIAIVGIFRQLAMDWKKVDYKGKVQSGSRRMEPTPHGPRSVW